MSSSNGVLIFKGMRACRNCQKKVIKSLKTNPQQICKPCIRGLKREYCMHCKKDYHQLEADVLAGNPNRCKNCVQLFREHGNPSVCRICFLNSAFGGNECRHCKKNQERYGMAIVCEKCQKCCAFEKPKEKKVDGKNLCFVCSREHKLQENRESKKSKREKKHRQNDYFTSKRKRKTGESDKKKKKSKLSHQDATHHEPSYTSDDFTPKKRRYSSISREPAQITFTVDQMESIKKENAALKKQLEEQSKKIAHLNVTVDSYMIRNSKLKREIQDKEGMLGEYKAQNHELKDGLEKETHKVRRECKKEIRDQKIAYRKLLKKFEALKQEQMAR